tara:strand:+ start:67 stop:336 length:270 start_codon:yes stop_codon:yes gene_type:complete
MNIASKSYEISDPRYGILHYKDILIKFQGDLLSAGIERADYEDVDFCGAEGATIYLNGVTNPRAWEILEKDFGYESHYAIDEDGEEHED